MTSSGFLLNPGAGLVADASVIINLNATARAADIIDAIPHPFLVTENAFSELEAGAGKSPSFSFRSGQFGGFRAIFLDMRTIGESAICSLFFRPFLLALPTGFEPVFQP
jgi:hypothetical protein